MNINYICNHILRTIHLQIRQYSTANGNKLLQYYGTHYRKIYFFEYAPGKLEEL